jgi:hypothetical protein
VHFSPTHAQAPAHEREVIVPGPLSVEQLFDCLEVIKQVCAVR